MIVVIPSWMGDFAMAHELANLAGQCAGDHSILRYHRQDDGYVVQCKDDDGPEITVGKAWSGGWPRSCTSMFKLIMRDMPVNSPVLWLEPDAVLTRPSALNELDELCQSRKPFDLKRCVFGHWKVPGFTPDAPVEHYSGCSVYVTTPELLDAVERVNPNKSWDLELFNRRKLPVHRGYPTSLIRCLWHRDGPPIEPDVLEKYPEACVIHGDKRGVLLRAVQDRFRQETKK